MSLKYCRCMRATLQYTMQRILYCTVCTVKHNHISSVSHSFQECRFIAPLRYVMTISHIRYENLIDLVRQPHRPGETTSQIWLDNLTGMVDLLVDLARQTTTRILVGNLADLARYPHSELLSSLRTLPVVGLPLLRGGTQSCSPPPPALCPPPFHTPGVGKATGLTTCATPLLA